VKKLYILIIIFLACSIWSYNRFEQRVQNRQLKPYVLEFSLGKGSTIKIPTDDSGIARLGPVIDFLISKKGEKLTFQDIDHIRKLSEDLPKQSAAGL